MNTFEITVTFVVDIDADSSFSGEEFAGRIDSLGEKWFLVREAHKENGKQVVRFDYKRPVPHGR